MKPNTKTRPDKLINGWRDTNESSERRNCRRCSTQIAGKNGGTTNIAMAAMNSGSTVGDSDTIGQSSGQCHKSGVYAANVTQFMGASSHASVLTAMVISRYGCLGWRRHSTTTSVTMLTSAR